MLRRAEQSSSTSKKTMVPTAGLEPAQVAPLAPQTSASTNFATSAWSWPCGQTFPGVRCADPVHLAALRADKKKNDSVTNRLLRRRCWIRHVRRRCGRWWRRRRESRRRCLGRRCSGGVRGTLKHGRRLNGGVRAEIRQTQTGQKEQARKHCRQFRE